MASSSGLNKSPITWLKDPIMLMEIIAGQFKAEVSSLLNDHVLKFESDMSKYNEIQSCISEAVIRKLEEMVKTNVLKMNELLTEVYEERRNRFDSLEVGTPAEPVPSEETKHAVYEALKQLKTTKTEDNGSSGDAGDSQVENEEEKIIYVLVEDSDDDSTAGYYDHPNLRRSYYYPQPSSPLQGNSDESNDSLQDLLARDRILNELESESECNEEEMEEQTQEEAMVKRGVNDGMAGRQAVEPFYHSNEPVQHVMMVKQEVNDGIMAGHDQAVAGHQAIHLFHLNNNPGDKMTVKQETDDNMSDSNCYNIDDSD